LILGVREMMGKDRSNQGSGFTLIELLIGLIVSSILAWAIINLFTSQQQAYSVQEQIAEARQSARNAIDLLSRELRAAGNGVPFTYLSQGYTGGTELNVASAQGFSPGDIINITDPSDNSEAATVVSASGSTLTISSALNRTYAARSLVSLEKISQATENSITFKSDITNSGTVLTTTYLPSSTSLMVATNSGFSTGDQIYINDGSRWEVATVSGTPGANTINLTSPLSTAYPAGSRVNRLDTVSYVFTDNTLKRSLNSGPAQPLAENTAYLEFRYYDKDNNLLANPSPYSGVNLSATERSKIRRIKIQIIVRTAREDPNWTESGTYGDGTNYSDGYHRVLLESDIKLRNLSY